VKARTVIPEKPLDTSFPDCVTMSSWSPEGREGSRSYFYRQDASLRSAWQQFKALVNDSYDTVCPLVWRHKSLPFTYSLQLKT